MKATIIEIVMDGEQRACACVEGVKADGFPAVLAIFPGWEQAADGSLLPSREACQTAAAYAGMEEVIAAAREMLASCEPSQDAPHRGGRAIFQMTAALAMMAAPNTLVPEGMRVKA